nr:cysteine-rich repeat secretory protein 38-like [Ziziphus jujuba var. spinosa]
MSSSILLGVFYVVVMFMQLLLTPTIGEEGCSSKAEYCWNCISEVENYTSTTTYKNNLNNLLTSISSGTQNSYGFYNLSLGENSNKVNVIAMCRGEVTAVDCRTCLNDTSYRLLERCPNRKEAIIWDERCMVRYSNNSIFYKRTDAPLKAFSSPNAAADPEQFKLVLKPLLDDLKIEAASGNSSDKCPFGNNTIPNAEGIFALVQCTSDLNVGECNGCLDHAILHIPDCCGGKQGGRFLKPSCNLRFESGPFYNEPKGNSTQGSDETGYGFYNSSLGENSNKVNGIALCRGDIEMNIRHKCINESSRRLLENCPNRMEPIIWEELCMVRYSNTPIFSVMKDEPIVKAPSTNKAWDPNKFMLVLKPMLDGLTSKASSGDSQRKFSTENGTVPGYETIYALTQCTPDISKQGCRDCLQRATLILPECCNGVQGARILRPSCSLRYEVYPFYNYTADSPAASPPLKGIYGSL